ncbi:MAG: prolipoprotein diacylglyceryl transferase, partial [Myxococcales bacterium]|nr:prolipoprotein diacylglyceryl transferase [Myxococcales bacterium]
MDFFHWNFDPVLVRIPLGFDAPLLGDNIQIRWYGLFFAIGLLLAVQRLGKSFVDRGLSEEHAASLSWIIPVSMILFAHLIHLVFYEPRSFIDNPRRIIEIGKGLASHGGAVGVIVAVYWFARAHGRTFHEYMDAVMVASVWCFPWVRIGNFFNSEIVGRTTDVPWAVVFEQVDPANARHPQQIYEALAGFALIGITELLDRKYRDRLRRGSLFYVSLGLYFSYRFALEFFKEKQGVDVEWSLNMGHLLSI